MLSEEEKKAIELLEYIKNNSWTTKYIMSSDSKNADILLKLITKLQKENEEKDKQIDLIAEKLAKAYHYKPRECSLKEKEDIDCNKYNDCTSCVKQYFETKMKGE